MHTVTFPGCRRPYVPNMLKSGGVCAVTHPHFCTVWDMHVRTDHINRHASVSGPYGDSTGAISNGAAQFSVILRSTVSMATKCLVHVVSTDTVTRQTQIALPATGWRIPPTTQHTQYWYEPPPKRTCRMR